MLNQRALARAVVPQHRDKGALLHVKVHAVHGLHVVLVVAVAGVLDFHGIMGRMLAHTRLLYNESCVRAMASAASRSRSSWHRSSSSEEKVRSGRKKRR